MRRLQAVEYGPRAPREARRQSEEQCAFAAKSLHESLSTRSAEEDRMRKVLYGDAMSLDGFIAGPNGEDDWIVMDPDMDFAEMMGQFDTFLIGRKTFEAMRRMGSDVTAMPGTQNIVFSRTLRPSEHPHVTISADAERVVADLPNDTWQGHRPLRWWRAVPKPVGRRTGRRRGRITDSGPAWRRYFGNYRPGAYWENPPDRRTGRRLTETSRR
jgi:hypothetical protein